MKQNQKNGYILVLTLMIISILVIVVTRMFYAGSSQTIISRTMVDRLKAKQLALSGVQLAISRLYVTPSEPQEKEKKSKEVIFLERVLPVLNRWETINLKEDIDGIDAQIKTYLACENGKININKVYNYQTRKFKDEGQVKGDIKILLTEMLNKGLEKFTQNKDLVRGLQEYLKKRKYILNDVTELLEIKEFEYFKEHVFCEPVEDKTKPVYLTDIFTIWTDSDKLQPWLLSDSILASLGLKRANSKDIDQREQVVPQWLKKFKPQIQFPADWNSTFTPIFGKDFSALPKGIGDFFDTTFDASAFSIISYATVNDVTQKLFAIVQKRILSDNEIAFELIKLYWI